MARRVRNARVSFDRARSRTCQSRWKSPDKPGGAGWVRCRTSTILRAPFEMTLGSTASIAARQRAGDPAVNPSLRTHLGHAAYGSPTLSKARRRGRALSHSPHGATWFFSPLLALRHARAAGINTGVGVSPPGARGERLYNFAWSLRHGAVSRTRPLPLSFVVTTMLAVLVLGEALTASKIAGVAMALSPCGCWWLRQGPAALTQPGSAMRRWRACSSRPCSGFASSRTTLLLHAPGRLRCSGARGRAMTIDTAFGRM